MSTQATSWQTRRGAEQPRRQRRAQQRGDVAGVGELGQHGGADGQQRDEPRGEARLRGDAARVGLHARGLLEPARRSSAAGRRGRRPASRCSRIAATIVSHAGAPARRAQALEHVLGARAERERAGRRAQLGARGARARRPRPPPPSAPRTAWPPASASASARAAAGAARASSARQRSRRARDEPRRRRADRPPRRPRPRRDRPAASRPPAARRRRRAPAAGARAASARGPRGRTAPSGSSQRADDARGRRLLDGRQRLPRAGHRQRPGEPGEQRRPSITPPRRSASSSLSAARQRGRPARQPNSSRVAGPPATRTTSATATTRRVPSGSRAWWTTRSIASATCSRIAACGSPTPAISASVSRRRSASSGEPAWTVDSEPSWPVVIAASMSSASAAADLAHDDAVGPHPQRVAHQVGGSSPRRGPRRSPAAPRGARRGAGAGAARAASSIVTIRSPAGTNDDSALSVVVLPEPVPPLTRMFRRARTARASRSRSGGSHVPASTRSSALNPRARKRRTSGSARRAPAAG